MTVIRTKVTMEKAPAWLGFVEGTVVSAGVIPVWDGQAKDFSPWRLTVTNPNALVPKVEAVRFDLTTPFGQAAASPKRIFNEDGDVLKIDKDSRRLYLTLTTGDAGDDISVDLYESQGVLLVYLPD